MSEMNDPQIIERVDELETIMVRLFRLFQHLFSIVKDERQLLIAQNADELSGKFNDKSSILTSIERVELERKNKTIEISRILGQNKEDFLLSGLLDHLPGSMTERIRHIQQGILSLQKEIREINDGNFALANLNLQQVQAVQQFLVNALQPPSTYYGPNKNVTIQNTPTTWQMDQNV